MFRDDMDELLPRIKKFHEKARPGSALFEVVGIDEIRRPPVDLTQWNFPDDMENYLREEYEKAAAYWRQRRYLKDDRIPSITAWYGIAEHSAYVGGDVVFGKDTSYHKPFLTDWDDLDKLVLREDNPWRLMIDNGLRCLKSLAGDDCAVSLRGSYGPMEVANSIRGNDLLTDFYLYPDETRALMEFCSKAVSWNLLRQREVVGQFHGGYVSGFKSWIPGNSFGQISEDTSTLTGPHIYRDFGLPYTRSSLESVDAFFLHTHAVGEESLPVMLELEKLYMLEISSDPNSHRAIEVARDRADMLRHTILVLNLTAEEIRMNLDFLKERPTIIWYSAKGRADAEQMLEFVRKELPIE